MDSDKNKPTPAQKVPQDPSPNAAAPQGSLPPTSTRKLPAWMVPVTIFAVAAALFWFISAQWTNWESSGSIKTDDAYVRADVAPLSTKMAGTVQETHVN